ncbi:hypothetical protein SMGD1_1915 [Sulfurimonas gotlandica GD1]|uniref:Uncharacterized protein n=1 Tax=Sulfurimonas gotlandica (strain DSM 19862 / JCM 16533 / GD1) TaxID=929558 RepID=B6BIS8_SULGG|nr:hypothetical protein CBGD1_424 [Sulfurimonas gotlandica GD1]EHP30438.1 hypothetical protein SMGD1_1915 [Sulfurimonas gotlandica GD1]
MILPVFWFAKIIMQRYFKMVTSKNMTKKSTNFYLFQFKDFKVN